MASTSSQSGNNLNEPVQVTTAVPMTLIDRTEEAKAALKKTGYTGTEQFKSREEHRQFVAGKVQQVTRLESTTPAAHVVTKAEAAEMARLERMIDILSSDSYTMNDMIQGVVLLAGQKRSRDEPPVLSNRSDTEEESEEEESEEEESEEDDDE